MSATTDMLASTSTPDKVESRLGTLEFDDGAPSEATAALLYDHLDFIHGVEAFLGALPGASLAAVRRGYLSMGIEDNSFSFFPELMDSASVFLTANCDTVYFWGFVDLSDGPMVIDVPSIEAPSGVLGVIDDMWFRWVTDFGLSGPDRGQGGRYLLVGPGYDGPLPDSGFHVSHVRTTRATVIGRAFMIDNDPTVPVEVIRTGFRVSPYVPGAQGTAVGTFLAGDAPLGAVAPAPETRFVDATGKSFNTVYPNDFGFWELVNELVQQEPPGASDPDLLGLLASVGIVHGKPFEPDARMRKILEEAVEVGNATARTVTFAARPEEGFAVYPGSAWESALFVGGYEFLDPPPQITAEGVVAAATDGARKLSSRTNFFYMATGITPAMCMRLTGIGSQYIYAMRDSRGRVPRRRPQLSPHASARHSREPVLVGDPLRPPDPLHAPNGSTPASHRQPVRHRRDEPRRLDRHLLRAHGPRRKGVQLAPDHSRQGLVDDSSPLQPAPAVLRQELAAERDRGGELDKPDPGRP